VAPPSEGGIATSQILAGSLATLTTGVLVALVAAGTDSGAVAVVGVGSAPAVGGWTVCAIGRTSKQYEGGCAPSVLGGYLGAIAFGIPMAYFGAAEWSPVDQDGGGRMEFIGAIYGAVLGVIVGTGVGATIAWHLSKHRREQPAALAFGPPLPPPAALASWSELQARPTAARASAPLGVQLLSLRF
jgi:hypothetical protein